MVVSEDSLAKITGLRWSIMQMLTLRKRFYMIDVKSIVGETGALQ